MADNPAEVLQTNRFFAESAARLSLKNRVLERLLALYSDPPAPARLPEDLLDTAMEACPCEAASFFAAGKKGEIAIVAARGRVSAGLKGLRLKVGQGLAGACAAHGETIAVSDVAHDSRHAAEVSKALGFETRSMLVVPVLRGSAAVGVIELINKAGSNQFQRHEVELVERVARTAGDLLSRSRGKR